MKALIYSRCSTDESKQDVICCVNNCKKEAYYNLTNNLIPSGISFCKEHCDLFNQHNEAREKIIRQETKAQALKDVLKMIDEWEDWIFNHDILKERTVADIDSDYEEAWDKQFKEDTAKLKSKISEMTK